MKVITNGNFVGTRVTCILCTCEYEIEAGDSPGDLMRIEGNGKVTYRAWFQCPQCNNLNVMPPVVVTNEESA